MVWFEYWSFDRDNVHARAVVRDGKDYLPGIEISVRDDDIILTNDEEDEQYF